MITHHDFGGIQNGNTISCNLFAHESVEEY